MRIIREMLSLELDRFLQDNRIDPPVARDLRNESPAVQFAVLDRGDLVNANNPSGALIGRIREAKQKIDILLTTKTHLPGFSHLPPPPPQALSLLPPPPPPPGLPRVDIEKFIVDCRLDHASVMALRAEPKDLQEKVVLMGAMIGTSNTSASLMGRIRAVKSGVIQGVPPPPPGAMLPAHMVSSVAPPPPPAPVGIDNNLLAAEAARAAAKLNQGEGDRVERIPMVPPGEAPSVPITGNTLNDEAMKAIAAMNASL
jgi:hypothetical protein